MVDISGINADSLQGILPAPARDSNSSNLEIVENQENALRRDLEEMQEALYRDTARPLQRESYACAAKCLQSSGGSANEDQKCVSECFRKTQLLQQLAEHEMNRFQSRLQRCSADCQDRVQDSQTFGSDHSMLEREYSACAQNCLAMQRERVPQMLQNIKARLNGEGRS